MATINLQNKKRDMFKEITKAQMKVLEFADICRDMGEDAEYQQAVALYKRLESTKLN